MYGWRLADMSYRDLLDPKAAAKSRAKNGIKSHGPQQSRKSTAPQTSEPKSSPVRFDPKALLNPKVAAISKATSSATEINVNSRHPPSMDPTLEDGGPGMAAMLERHYGIEKREAPPPRKRKSGFADDDGSDEERKKAKNGFNMGKSTGEIGQHLKEEREKGAAQSEFAPLAEPTSNPKQAVPIDLTNDDDDDIVITGESKGEETREVCLGRLHSNAMVFQIPQVQRYQIGKVGKDFWPQSRIYYRRIQARNTIIELMSKPVNGSNVPLKFGNMDGKLASALCPLLDGISVNKIRLKMYMEPFQKRPGEFPGHKVSRSVTISVIVYAPRNRADMIGRFLSQKQFFLSQPFSVEPGVQIYNPHEPKVLGQLKNTCRRPQSSTQIHVISRTQEEIIRETTTMFDNLVKSENLPEMAADPKIITQELLSHQKQALHFLTQHERIDQDQSADHEVEGEGKATFSLWKPRTTRKGEAWYNVITGHEVDTKPEPTRGGILADVMGLGKTLSILSLVADTLVEARKFGEEEAPVDLEDVKRNVKATLIICPKSVMSNWEEQIKSHTKAGRLKVYSYHGTNRTQDLDELAKYNVVLVPYQTAAAEFSNALRKRTAIASINWFRVVLDEAHQIRNPSTHVSKACCRLNAQRRWAVTGTPVQNRLDDLGALIKFLRIKPFDDERSWAQYITAPFRTADTNVLTNLRLLVDSITLRRTKDGIGLTDRQEYHERLDFNDEESSIYRQFARASNMQLRLMLAESGRLQGKSYAHVLKSLGRLRAICAHGREMLSPDDLKELEGLTAGTAIDLGDEPDEEPDDTFIVEKHAYETFDLMRDSEVNICAGCHGKLGERKDNGDADVVELSGDSDEEEEPSRETSADIEVDEDTICNLTPCFHLLCQKCTHSFMEQTKDNLTEDHYHTCIYCEQYVRWGLFKLTYRGLQAMLDARSKKNKKGNKAKWDETTYSGPHTKVKALLNDLQKSREESRGLPADEPPIRSVVFSGWTTYLDLIEYALDEREIGYVRLDGSMSIKARSAVLKDFTADANIEVLLVSIKAGGQGLNFTAANKVYMMEPQFNPGVENQAIDRVHRLGQTRNVEIKHYIMKDSVEEKILKLQRKKEDLAKLSMDKKMKRGEDQKKRIEELRDLFK